MDLDLFSGRENNEKKNSVFRKFFDEVRLMLDKQVDFEGVNMDENIDSKIITEFRDKILLERNKILVNYQNETIDKGEMIFVYDSECCYHACLCREGFSHEVVSINQEEMPEGADVFSVLRKSENGYVLDSEGTKIVDNRINEMKQVMLEEQSKFLQSKRIEGHVYEVSDVGEDRVWLFDITEDDGEEIEEIGVSEELLGELEIEDRIVYRNGDFLRNDS
ncbi:MAG: hypothetical protein IKF52_00440 [Clostridia bacterium]|nr:hypothetical protein [Clostridia bacterium]